jgi:hypothetical protein
MRSSLTWIWIIALQVFGVIPASLATEHAKREYAAALEFRKIFAGHAQAHYSQDAIEQLIFLPNSKVLERSIAGAATVEDVLANHRTKLQTIKPSQLFQEAAQTPHPETGAAPRHPVTFVIIPGIFGEFIDHIPYEEILQNGESSLAQTWSELSSAPDFTDAVFDLESMQAQQRPMRELVQAGSLDDEAGRAQTRIILLKAPKTSLESLGTLAESAAIYQRRLSKIFDRIGAPENAYFLGYSRGLNVGMELVATSDVNTHPWMRGFKGLIGLGGVTYGSAVADRALNPERMEGKVFQRVKQLAEELEVPTQKDNAMSAAALMLRNTGRWAAALAEMASYGAQLASPEGLQLENIQSDGMDLGFMVRTFRDIALESFQLDRPFADYARNIKRFQIFVREAMEGIQSLGTESCLLWIKTHRLPETLHYYAITSTMPDPSTPATGVSPLTGNTVAYEPAGLDYRGLRMSYYSYLEESGMSLNDSQISLDRSPFWPELHQLANPRQKLFPATLLAVLGTDHWGMAFPVAFETESGKVNPFPRTILMKTLGDYLGSKD